MTEFIIPGHARPAARMTQKTKWTERARQGLEYQDRVGWYAAANHVPKYDGDVVLTCRFTFSTKRHGDLSNLVKAIEDGLQYANVLINDKQVKEYGAGTGIYYGDVEQAVVIIQERGI